MCFVGFGPVPSKVLSQMWEAPLWLPSKGRISCGHCGGRVERTALGCWVRPCHGTVLRLKSVLPQAWPGWWVPAVPFCRETYFEDRHLQETRVRETKPTWAEQREGETWLTFTHFLQMHKAVAVCDEKRRWRRDRVGHSSGLLGNSICLPTEELRAEVPCSWVFRGWEKCISTAF